MLRIIHRPPFIIHHYPSLGSTNDQLKQMIGAPEFTCVVADQQTAGRGRRDRSWLSSRGDGLYLSLLLCPPLQPQELPLLSLMAAVAVTETVACYTRSGLDIKWPNDVLIHERKVSGILIEGVSSGKSRSRIVVGIGVNLNHRSFPPELSETATSLALECGRFIEPAEFRDQLLAQLLIWYEHLCHEGKQIILRHWQRLSSYAQGKRITVTFDHEQLTGETAGLSETGALLLRTDTGEMKTLLAGEVSRVRSSE